MCGCRLTRITPAAQRLGAGQVVVRAGGADGQQADTEDGQFFGLGDQPVGIRDSGLAAHRGRPFDVGRVTPDGGAVVGQHSRLGGIGGGVGEAVPDVGMLGNQAQGLLLAAKP